MDYQERVRDAKTRITEVTVREAMDRRAKDEVLLLDVREMNEWSMFHIPGAMHVPLAEVSSRASEIPQDRPVVIYCQSGNRSAIAADELQKAGISDVSSMAGGIREWAGSGGEVET